MNALAWYTGWTLILMSFLTGAAAGLCFHRADFLGGYGSFRRRLVRLGHIALAALGMLNILYAVAARQPFPEVTSLLLFTGSVSMPLICFLSAWREPWRHLFFIPVVSLVLAVALVIRGGMP